jgi:hypothetical protein
VGLARTNPDHPGLARNSLVSDANVVAPIGQLEAAIFADSDVVRAFRIEKGSISQSNVKAASRVAEKGLIP